MSEAGAFVTKIGAAGDAHPRNQLPPKYTQPKWDALTKAGQFGALLDLTKETKLLFEQLTKRMQGTFQAEFMVRVAVVCSQKLSTPIQ
jgi:hypothetical protein